ncbi:MAG: type II toxin-antitoxin system RelE/ParE family toxin [Deltaproteobacteria bacterium]|nr:type II toxin-antitoxin system RelE/ParE family toxin [Deltaproteobacteria bacterium]
MFCFTGVRAILVFHAFVKKTEKTPKREIELGRKRLLTANGRRVRSVV